MATVGKIFEVIDALAPFSLAEKGDNSGLIVGNKENKVKKALIALDITNEVANEAAGIGAELIISHHPVIYNPLYSLSDENPANILAKNGISAICAHTNLDMAPGGVSDALAEALGFEGKKVIEVIHRMPFKQVCVFCPEEYAEKVSEAMFLAGGGQQGNYSHCAFFSKGVGQFMPNEKANPFTGENGKLEKTQEVRIEMLVPPSRLKSVISAMKDAHPYEEPAFCVYDNLAFVEKYGFGKLCMSETEFSANSLAAHIKERLGCNVVRYTDSGKAIKNIAVCSGAGGSLIRYAAEKGADALICGDIKHDQLISARNLGISVFDAGHFHTEAVILPKLKEVLANAFPETEFEIAAQSIDPALYE